MSLLIDYRGEAATYEVSEYLERSRLCRIFEEAARRPIVSVCAGTGYGKTRAALAFFKECRASATYLKLTESDNNSKKFWEDYSSAVSKTNRFLSAKISETRFPETAEAFGRYFSLLKDSCLSEKQILFLDDFHLISEPVVLNFFEKVAEKAPSNFTFIFISQSSVETKLLKLMFNNDITAVIDEESLRFTESEIGEYYRRLDISIAGQALRNIFKVTKGWPLPVNLIGQSLKKAPSRESYAMSAMKTNIFRLFEREAFMNASEDLQILLIKLSLINYTSADLVEILAKNPSLEVELNKLNGFIRYDAYINAYAAHPLFWEYLSQKQKLLSDDERREVYFIAAEWCDRNDYKKDALDYYERAGDYLAAATVICDYGVRMSPDTEEFGLEVLDRAPRDIIKNNPTVLIARLNLMLNLGRLDEVVEEAVNFEKDVLASPNPDYFQLSGAMRRAAVARYFLCAVDGRYDFDEFFARQNKYFSKKPGKLKPIQSAGPWILTLGAERPEDYKKYLEAVERSETSITHPLNPCFAGFSELAQGELCFYQNDIKAAEKFFALGLEKAGERWDIQNRVLFYQMRLAFFKGEDADAVERRLTDLSARLLENGGGNKYVTSDIVRAWYYSASRRPKLAAEIFQNGFAYGSGSFSSGSFENWVKAQYYYAIGRYDELLSYLSSRGQKEIFLLGRLEMKALEAVCRNQLKDKEGAFKALEEAYSLAAPGGFITPFIELGKDMRTLSASAIKSNRVNIPRERLELINRKASAYAKRQSHIASGYKGLDKGASLSRREREILEDISRGLSRSEIAASRGLSINTIKATVSMVYSKLGACNMAEVIRIAAENELLK